MKPDQRLVRDVLDAKDRYVVPLYQRQYQWHDHPSYGGLTASFWYDLALKAEDLQDGENPFGHYMGALLLSPDFGQVSSGATTIMHVVDGQQRLTTFLIFLAALREVAKEKGCDEFVPFVEHYLFNKKGPGDKDPLAEYKLVPTPSDRDLLLDIMRMSYPEVRSRYKSEYWGGRVPQNTTKNALRAYEYFRGQIGSFCETGGVDEQTADSEDEDAQDAVDRDEQARRAQAEAAGKATEARLRSLLDALLEHLKLIVITLEQGDDAQVIFETLNSKGEPLLAMDLVRNNIFHRAQAQHAEAADTQAKTEELYHTIWSPFDDGWWRENAPNARPVRPRIDHFLAYVLTAETGNRTTVRDLYGQYRLWAEPNRKPRFDQVEDELSVLQRHVPAYEALEGRSEDGDVTLRWLGERLRAWQRTTAYPIAFMIADRAVDSELRRRIARAIDSYLTRRELSDLTSKALNKVLPRLAAAFKRDGVSWETLQAFFAELDTPTTRFPDDDELVRAMIERPAYHRMPTRVLTDILWRLELASRTNKTEATVRPDNLSIEHIMPQSWTEHWPLLDEGGEPIGSDDPRHLERGNAIHTIGNLTLVTTSLNPAMRNGPFGDKKAALQEHSNLTLNKRLAEFDTWDEAAIGKRGETLAALACEVWPDLERG